MKVNKENLYYGRESNKYTVLEQKQIEKTMEELNELTNKVGVDSRIEMTIQKEKWSKVSIWVSGFASPIFVSKTEKNLTHALYKVRKLTINKMRSESKKEGSLRAVPIHLAQGFGA